MGTQARYKSLHAILALTALAWFLSECTRSASTPVPPAARLAVPSDAARDPAQSEADTSQFRISSKRSCVSACSPW